MEVNMTNGAVAWLSDPRHPNFEAAAKAIEKVYGVAPDYTREGGSIPITPAIEDATGMNVLLLPIGACDDMAHSQNEKYNIINLVNGIKVSSTWTLLVSLKAARFISLSIRFLFGRSSGCIYTSLARFLAPSLQVVDAFHLQKQS
jgi:hypothetical protein